MNLNSPFLYPILDENRSANLVEDAHEIIRAGARIIQIRAKLLSNDALYEIAVKLLPRCKEADVLLVLNDRVDVCLAAGVPAIHLGQDDFPVLETRKIMPHAIIGLSTHNLNQLRDAENLPVDYVSIGPIYATTSKKNADPVVGISLLQQALQITRKPIVCIGGIRADNIPDLIRAGAKGIAVISELYAGKNIFNHTKRLLNLISGIL